MVTKFSKTVIAYSSLTRLPAIKLQSNQMPPPAQTVSKFLYSGVQARRRPLAKPISVHLGKHRLVRGLVCFIQFNLPVPPPLIDRTYFSLFAVNLLWLRARNNGQILTHCDFALIWDFCGDILICMCSFRMDKILC